MLFQLKPHFVGQLATDTTTNPVQYKELVVSSWVSKMMNLTRRWSALSAHSTMSRNGSPKAKSLRNSPQQKTVKNRSMDRSNRSAQPGMKLYRKIPDQTRIARVLRTLSTLNVNASSVLATSAYPSSLVSSNSEFSNIAQEFQSYRVRQMKLHLLPVYNASSAVPGTNDYPQSALLMGLWWERPASGISNILQTDGMRLLETGKKHVIETNFLGYPDAQLWTATNATIGATESYGYSFCTSLNFPTLEASSQVFIVCLEFDVEFQGMQ